mmetsp:Transcript_18335/g.39751  ORF Transcript_18335/g.39751 Transcript_18335/m.39751 type:complete len:247 (-) Transcript_18335:38-778(-)
MSREIFYLGLGVNATIKIHSWGQSQLLFFLDLHSRPSMLCQDTSPHIILRVQRAVGQPPNALGQLFRLVIPNNHKLVYTIRDKLVVVSRQRFQRCPNSICDNYDSTRVLFLFQPDAQHASSQPRRPCLDRHCFHSTPFLEQDNRLSLQHYCTWFASPCPTQTTLSHLHTPHTLCIAHYPSPLSQLETSKTHHSSSHPSSRPPANQRIAHARLSSTNRTDRARGPCRSTHPAPPQAPFSYFFAPLSS